MLHTCPTAFGLMSRTASAPTCGPLTGGWQQAVEGALPSAWRARTAVRTRQHAALSRFKRLPSLILCSAVVGFPAQCHFWQLKNQGCRFGAACEFCHAPPRGRGSIRDLCATRVRRRFGGSMH